MDVRTSEERADAIRALVASSVRLYREGLEEILRGTFGVEVMGSACSAAETIAQVRLLAPSVVLLDMAMEDALEVARQLSRHSRTTKLIALGVPELEYEILSCAAVGVAGYVTRAGSENDVIEAVRAAACGDVHCSARVAGFLVRHIATTASQRGGTAPDAGLTTREAQIRRLLRQGMSNKMISRTLGIELPTVKNHVHSILGKLGVHRRAEVILLFPDEGRANRAQGEEP